MTARTQAWALIIAAGFLAVTVVRVLVYLVLLIVHGPGVVGP